MSLITTYCQFHLGDGFAACHLLRYLAKLHPEHEFHFHASAAYRKELLCFTEDAPNLVIGDLDSPLPDNAVCLWKNSPNDFWANHSEKWDYARFTRRYYRKVIRQLGFHDSPPGLLFDLPCLNHYFKSLEHHVRSTSYDVLVVNSKPGSGQFMDYSHEDAMRPMVTALRDKGLRVVTTKPELWNVDFTYGMTCAEIGVLSNHIPVMIGVATGPMWLCLNKFSQTKSRIILCEKETVDLHQDGSTVNCRTIAEAMRVLQERGLV